MVTNNAHIPRAIAACYYKVLSCRPRNEGGNRKASLAARRYTEPRARHADLHKRTSDADFSFNNCKSAEGSMSSMASMAQTRRNLTRT